MKRPFNVAKTILGVLELDAESFHSTFCLFEFKVEITFHLTPEQNVVQLIGHFVQTVHLILRNLEFITNGSTLRQEFGVTIRETEESVLNANGPIGEDESGR